MFNNELFHNGTVSSLWSPFSANKRPRLPWRHHWKAMHCSSTALGWWCKLDSITIATWIPRFDCHISLYRLKMNISYNFLDIHNDSIDPFTHSNRREMCSLESFLITWVLDIVVYKNVQKRGQFLQSTANGKETHQKGTYKNVHLGKVWSFSWCWYVESIVY